MLLKPAKSKKPAKNRISIPGTKLAPIAGWNARDPWASVPEGQAIVLDNWFPRPSWVETRRGYLLHKEDLTDIAKTLVPYTSGTTSKLWVATDDGIYDATTGGTFGAAAFSLTQGHVQHTIFQNSAGWFNVLVNGQDEMRQYDGTTWKAINASSTPAITGVLTSQIINVNVFKRRLFLIPLNKLSFYYLPVDSVGGAATEFNLSGIFSKGGYLMAMGTWTLDGGSGVDDLAVFITSEGQAAVYQGTDPGNANSWSLVGVYDLARPVGRKCFCKYGGDLLLMLEDGLYPLSKAFQSSTVDRTVSISDSISGAWVDAVETNKNTTGWSVTTYLPAPFILVNVPIGGGGTNSVQFVMNTQNRAWTRFTGIGGQDWAVLGSTLYMCKGTSVYRTWTGFNDNGSNITAYAKSGYDPFGSPGNNKQWKLIRPNLQVVSAIQVLVGLAVDFRDEFLTGSLPPVPPSGGVWDASNWDGATWAADFTVQQLWASVEATVGHYAATLLQVASNSNQTRWMNTDHIYETGDYL